MKKTEKTNSLLTPLGMCIDRYCPLKEHPRPQMQRRQWRCLNGHWNYAICDGIEHPKKWDGRILVPFSPESALSGVGRQLLPGQTLWYSRTFRFKKITEGRLLLHFGAVDQHCSVFCNGRLVAKHSGGYWPFYADITDAVCTGYNIFEVSVTDDSDGGNEAYGKQKLKRGGIWYTAQSGIWQTVWCEHVPEVYIDNLRITPHCESEEVEVELISSTGKELSGTVLVLDKGAEAARGELNGNRVRLSLPGFKYWSPDTPFLYTLKITAGSDEVESYFGMRSFGLGTARDGTRRLTLNGKPIFHNGVLDQGYWSDGMYTPSCDGVMIWDILHLKLLGFNMLRKHIKIEPLRWYYYCDKLGMLVWQDFVSGGGPYGRFATQFLPFTGVRLRDDGEGRGFGRKSTDGRAVFERDMERTTSLLYNVVSLAVWVPFNEGWGQFDASRIADKLRAIDSTRAIDHASGWHDQKGGDIHSHHVYYKRFHPKRDKHGRVLALTEFGGFSLPIMGHVSTEKPFGYEFFRTSEEYDAAISELYKKDVFPALKKGLGAVVYTQLSDVEDEVNGLVTYDRFVTKPGSEMLLELNRRLYKEFEKNL